MAGRDVRFDIIANDKASSTLKKVGAAAEDAGEGFDNLGSSVDDAGGKVSKIGDVMKGAVGAVAAAGVAIGGALVAGVKEAIDRGAMAEKLGAQLGLSQNETYHYGKLAGEIYAGAYGESLEEVNAAIKGVYQNVGKGNDEWTKSITGQVLTIADTFEQDLGMTTAAVGQLMRTGLAKDAQEALDVITFGLQNGADKAGDLLETFNEYGTQFRKMGISGAEATLLMSQGLQAGARDADIVADAIKEFSIRAIDGSDATVDGFKQLGVSAKEMQKAFSRGGVNARDSLGFILDKLRNVRDPAKRAAIAVQLFGTQAEDLGDALYALDLDGAASKLDEVAGASERVDEKMGKTLSARLTSLKRSFVNTTVGGIEVFINALDGTSEVGEFDGALGALNDTGVVLGQAWREKIAPALEVVGGWIEKVADWVTNDLNPGIRSTVNDVMPLFQVALDNLSKAFGGSSDSGTDWGKVISAAADVIEVALRAVIIAASALAVGFSLNMRALGWAIENVGKPAVKALWKAFEINLGLIVDAAAMAFGWIPGLGPKLKEAQRKFREFRDKVNAALDGIKDKYVNVNVRTVYSGGENYGQKESTNGRGGRAVGGGVMVGASYAVNERGQEMLKLTDRSAAVIPHAQSQRMLRAGGGGEVHNHFHLGGVIAPDRQSAARMLRSLMREAEMSGVAG